jgi:exoribonuclease-2
LLQNAGAIASAYDFHWQRFLFDNFPKGTGFPKLEAPAIAQALPLAAVQAYSIDDSQTTEIDDALSIQGLGTGTVIMGIHIAAPGLAIQPNGPIDQVGRSRLSTVYMPGYKITMLPGGQIALVNGLHAWLQNHHVARRSGARLHLGGRTSLPSGISLCHFRRSHLGHSTQ